MSTCQHVNMSTCLPVILSSCHPVILSSCYAVIFSSCLPLILVVLVILVILVILSSSNPVIQSSCHPVILSSCYPVILSSCHPVILPYVSMPSGHQVPLETRFIKLVKYQAQRLPGVVILHRICYWWTCNLYHHFSGILTHFGKVFLDRPPNLISVGKGNFGSFFHFRIQMSRAALEKDDFFFWLFQMLVTAFCFGVINCAGIDAIPLCPIRSPLREPRSPRGPFCRFGSPLGLLFCPKVPFSSILG